MNLELSKNQQDVLDSILGWYNKPINQYITLGGYAGTGKTTLLGYLNNTLHAEKKGIKIAYCSYTGKAAVILQRKLKETKALKPVDYVGTVHRLIYKAIVDDQDNIIGWEKNPIEDFQYDLIVLDEASMISEGVWHDLLSFGKPILAVGDHGQLPPIEGKFNLMEKPLLRLEEIYRQEKDNPIIKVSEIARKYGAIPSIEFSKTVKKLSKKNEDTQEFLTDMFSTFNSECMVLTGYNSTRIKLNEGIRQLLGFESKQPECNDRVICLKNNSEENIFNGMTGTILSISKCKLDSFQVYDTEIEFDGEENIFFGNISVDQFGKKEIQNNRNHINLFDFGYALTVHKAQGSQAKKVVVFEERFPNMSDDLWRRWLYTAVTRAEKELYIIG
ncbi:MAG: ATP-dependent RecD-like DNA helicase [Candidatus Dojkabacteria bacterium]